MFKLNDLNDLSTNPINSKSSIISITILLLSIIYSIIYTTAAIAAQVGPSTNYSKIEATALFANSNSEYLRNNAGVFADMLSLESSGNAGIYNGSCCYGLMQMSNSTLKSYTNLTGEQYANLSASEQISIYSQYVEDYSNDAIFKQLVQMQEQGATVGGRAVDAYFIAACIQLGGGNCKAAIANDCSSLSNGSGGDGAVNVCTMADKAAGIASSTTSTSTTSTNSSSSDNSQFSCFGCKVLEFVGDAAAIIPSSAAVITFRYQKFIIPLLVIVPLTIMAVRGMFSQDLSFFRNLAKFSGVVAIVSALAYSPLLLTSFAIPIVGAGIQIFADLSDSVGNRIGRSFAFGTKTLDITAYCQSSSSKDISAFTVEDQDNYDVPASMADSDTMNGGTASTSSSTAEVSDVIATDAIKSEIISPLTCLLKTLSIPQEYVTQKMDWLQEQATPSGTSLSTSIVMTIQTFFILSAYRLYEIVVSLILIGGSLSFLFGLALLPFAPFALILKTTKGFPFFVSKQLFLIVSVAAVVSIVNMIYLGALSSFIGTAAILSADNPGFNNGTWNITWAEAFGLAIGPIIGSIMQIYLAHKAVEMTNSLINRSAHVSMPSMPTIINPARFFR